MIEIDIKLFQLTVPVKGIIKPAPTDIDISVIGMVNPEGAPLIVGSAVRDKGVLAIHIGRPPKP